MFGALFAFDPKLAAWLFIFRLDCLFLLVDGIHGCQTSSQLSVCGDCSIGVFASARRNWGSGAFVFCFWWQMPRGPPRVLCVPRGRKSNQFSLVPNRKYFPTRSAMAVARRTLCSAWFLHRSFYLWAKPEEGDLFWIYALDSERVFACVAQSSCRGGLTGFWFKLLMNDGRLGFPFSSAYSCETRTWRRSQDRATVRRRCRASAITFLMPDHAGRVFRRWVCENLKYANSV